MALKVFAEKAGHANVDTCVVVILSHGNEQGILGKRLFGLPFFWNCHGLYLLCVAEMGARLGPKVLGTLGTFCAEKFFYHRSLSVGLSISLLFWV